MERFDRPLPSAVPLKPCPICDSPPVYGTREGYYSSVPTGWVTCSNIACQLGKCLFSVATWNNRPGEARLEAQVEQIRTQEALRAAGMLTEAAFAEELAAILGRAPTPRYTVLIVAARSAESALRALHAGYHLPDSTLDLADHLRVGLRAAGVPTPAPPPTPAKDA